MARNWLKAATVSALFISVAPVALAQSNPVHDSSYFAEKLYPVMKAAQCSLCHSDNGVGSATQLRFPDAQADAEQIATFGINLVSLVDRQNPEGSLLLLKPTKQVEPVMVGLRWPDGKVTCPRCGSEKVTWLAKARVWKCYAKHQASRIDNPDQRISTSAHEAGARGRGSRYRRRTHTSRRL